MCTFKNSLIVENSNKDEKRNFLPERILFGLRNYLVIKWNLIIRKNDSHDNISKPIILREKDLYVHFEL